MDNVCRDTLLRSLGGQWAPLLEDRVVHLCRLWRCLWCPWKIDMFLADCCETSLTMNGDMFSDPLLRDKLDDDERRQGLKERHSILLLPIHYHVVEFTLKTNVVDIKKKHPTTSVTREFTFQHESDRHLSRFVYKSELILLRTGVIHYILSHPISRMKPRHVQVKLCIPKFCLSPANR